MSMVPAYPKDRTTCMIKDGPVDPRFKFLEKLYDLNLNVTAAFPTFTKFQHMPLYIPRNILKQYWYTSLIPLSKHVKSVPSLSSL